MAETKPIDVSHIRFTSTVFPTAEDMKLWDSLTAEEQRAVVRRALDEGEASGVAEPESAEEIIRRVRAESRHGK